MSCSVNKKMYYVRCGAMIGEGMLSSVSCGLLRRIAVVEPNVWWPIAAIEKKRSKSRKNFQNREKNFRIQKNISGSKKNYEI